MTDRVGRFEVLSLIGTGGMGHVYRARDSRLGRMVALKRPRPDLLDRAGFRRRFLQEARSASKLLHPNVTAVFEVFEEDNVPWMAMELVDGVSLRSLLTCRAPLPIDEVVVQAEGLVSGLAAAHRARILHCDINPNNILAGNDGRLKLTDFGLARAYLDPEFDPSSSTLTANSNPNSAVRGAGTRGYMSPEQALGKELDPRTDVFSLGLVLYEMCTARPAFPAASDNWLDILLHHEPEPISQLNYEVPEELSRIIRKALAKRPDERYQSATDMLADVRALRRDLESNPLYPPETAPASNLRLRILGSTAAALALVLAATLSWNSFNQGGNGLRLADWTSRQLTSSPGWEAHPALSPDGNLIAHSSNESGNADIWLIDVTGGSRLQLTDDTAADLAPAWFPDGSWIAFVSDRSGFPAVWKVPRLGGSPILLVADAEDPALSPNGKQILFVRRALSGQKRVFVAPLANPAEAVAISDDSSGLWDHREPAWSPDGSTVCYADARDLWLVDADGSHPRRLTSAHASDRSPAYFSSGKIAFSSMRDGSFALWMINRNGDEPSRITLGTGPEREPSVSADGYRIAYSTRAQARDVVILNVARATRSRLPSVRIESSPVVAPDGSAVVFVSNRSGKFDLWIQQLQHAKPIGQPRRLTDHEGSVETPRFSSDGALLAYHRVIDGQRDIWVLSLKDGRSWQLTHHPGVNVNPTFSPDGTRLAFASNRSGREHLWVMPIVNGERAGEPTMITDGEQQEYLPNWSPDGTSIAFIRNHDVWITTATPDGQARQLTDGANASIVRWRDDTTLLVSGTWGTPEMHLRVVSRITDQIVVSTPPVVFGDATASGLFGADAERSVIAYIDSAGVGDLWLMERFDD